MRLRYIEIFHAVMQSGTVKGAAQVLHITQPAASRLLQQAEQHLGVALFRRVRGRLVPTLEAERLFPEVEQLYLQLDAVRRTAGNLGSSSQALLRLLCVPGLSLDALPQALGHWNRRHPQVRLGFRTLHSRQIADSLVRREAELGFALEPSAHPAIVSQAIAQGRIVCVGRDLPAGEVPIASLATRPVIDLDPTDPVGRLLHAAYRHHDIAPQARVTTHSYHAAIELAAEGFGWAIVDGWSSRYAQRHASRDSPRDAPLRTAVLAPEIPVAVYALRSRDLPSSAAIDDLVDGMAAALR